MKEPTKEEQRKLWEWCGLKWFWNHSPDCHCGAVDNDDRERSWYYKDGTEWRRATRFWKEEMVLDLNNLFKYAVPKAIHNLFRNGDSLKDTYEKLFKLWLDKWADGFTLEDALFWSIWDVVE